MDASEIVGLVTITYVVVTIINNLFWNVMGNRLDRRISRFEGEFWDRRRAKQSARNRAKAVYAERMLQLIEEDKSVLTILAHRAAKYEALGAHALIPSYFMVILGTIASMLSMYAYDSPRPLLYILLGIGLVSNVSGVISMFIGMRIRKLGEIYSNVIALYQLEKGIPLYPDIE
jgi:hypothetical protein